MKKVTAIGEALIDFIPTASGCRLSDVPGFYRECGGAPANAAAAAAKAGAESSIITMLGEDAFGDHIVSVLCAAGVSVKSVLRTKRANTALAFVSLTADGGREFTFYRSPSADMLLTKDDIKEDMLKDTAILHFCSVALSSKTVRQAHIRAIETVKKSGGIISFDPNIRLPLWECADECRRTVREFLPLADIIKLSDEELEFVTGISDISRAADMLLSNGAAMVIYSKGKNGAELFTRDFKASAAGISVKAVDTTGAGDALIGSFLGYLIRTVQTACGLRKLSAADCSALLERAVAFSAYSVTKKGAVGSYPDSRELDEFIRRYFGRDQKCSVF